MKIINMLKGFLISINVSVRRFPIAIGLTTAASILLMVLTNNEHSFSSETQELIGRTVMILALGIPVSLYTKLIFERKSDISLLGKAGTYVVEVLVLALYYFYLLRDFEMVVVTRYVAVSFSFYLVFMFIPYLFKRGGFELYVISLLTRFFTAVIYSIVLFLGIAAILFTVDKLLGVKIDELVYLDVWLGVVGIFAPSFFLAGVPPYDKQLEVNNYPKLLKVLLLYIVMPILSVYTAILYAYFAKIVLTLQWPVGMVAHLVLWYSAICAVIIFLISPLNEGNKWSKTFNFILPKAIIPLILMMFLSIGIRVKAYGITENRYFVILLGLWALGIMIYLNFAETKRNILLPVSLSLIAFLSVLGPWSSYSVSMFSQNQRLEGILQKYDMIRDNSIVKSKQEVSAVDKREISEILSYFQQAHTLNEVKHLPKEFTIGRMEDVFGFPNTDYNYYNNAKVHFIYTSNMLKGPLDIKGYSYMFPANSLSSSGKGAGYDLLVKYDNETHYIEISTKGRAIYKRSLSDFGKQIYKKFGSEDRYDINPDEMSFTEENQYIKVKYIFSHLDVYEDNSDGSVNVDSMDFYVLIELK